MKFPVNFITIEQELVPVASYLRGKVLNAGCGDRDISASLLEWQARSVDNCDIQTSIAGAFLCDLTAIPRPDGAYDSIFCNAVLEHVPDPEAVMAEFSRLLASGGYLVLSVPFLQPFHPTPFDFRRFTRQGVEQLAQRNGFNLLLVHPVHSLAQTLGWQVWAHLEERNSRLGKLLAWLPIYLATRIWRRPAPDCTGVANAFQAVMVKP
jgi:SAM-dependent methyltransferase